MAQADPATDAARQQVLKARGELIVEVERLETAARSAVDIKAQVRRSPAKAAALAGGAGFIVLGGPKRLLRGVKQLVRGRPEPYPSKLLPEEVDKVVRRLGDDGEKVRGVLEREFANYVTEKKRSDRRFWRNALFSGIVTPAATAAVRTAVKRAMSDPGQSGAAASQGSQTFRAQDAKAATRGTRNKPG